MLLLIAIRLRAGCFSLLLSAAACHRPPLDVYSFHMMVTDMSCFRCRVCDISRRLLPFHFFDYATACASAGISRAVYSSRQAVQHVA